MRSDIVEDGVLEAEGQMQVWCGPEKWRLTQEEHALQHQNGKKCENEIPFLSFAKFFILNFSQFLPDSM